jgi:hypothetical protein
MSIHFITWLTATLLTGIVCGFYLGHSLVLGPMFSWLAADGRQGLLWQTYSEFRLLHPPLPYLAVIAAQQVSIVAFLGVSLWQRRRPMLATAAAAFALIVPVFHATSGFGALERGVVSGGVRAPADLARFAAWNVPVHLLYAAATLAAFVALCFSNPSKGPE